MVSTVAYATVAEVKAQMDKEGAGSDTELTALILVASRSVDGTCNRLQDGFVTPGSGSAREFAGRGNSYIYIDECSSVSLVETRYTPLSDWEEWAATDWNLCAGEPRFPNYNVSPKYMLIAGIGGSFTFFPNGAYSGWPGFRPLPGDDRAEFRLLPTVRVTARWGYADVVPPVVKQATIVQATQWYKRGQGAWADAIANADTGELRYVKELDPAVKLMLLTGRMVRRSV